MSGMNSDFLAAATDDSTGHGDEAATFSVFELSLDASSDVAGLAIAISSLSASVEEVRVDIYNSFTTRWQEEGVAELFQALGHVPHLLKIEFYGLRIFPYRMPIAMAERTLFAATRLEEFSLVGINLDGDNVSFSQFSETLRQHPTLKTFALDNCRLRNEESGPTLDQAIVEPLVEIPSLEKVVIRAMEITMWGKLSCESVALLCKSKTLKSLELFVFSTCGSSFLYEMAKALILSNNQSQLEDLSISGCLGGMKGAKLLSEMIQVNTKLKSLELHLRSRTEVDDEEGIRELSKALANNKTLTKFQLHGTTNRTGSLETRKIFLQMLETNYSLLDGVQVFHPGFLRPEIEVYLRLNQVGRGRLLATANGVAKEEWIDTLTKVRHDLDCLYYFLKSNPLLCSNAGVGTTIIDDDEVPLKTTALVDGGIPRGSSACETTVTKLDATTSIPRLGSEEGLDCLNRKRKRHSEATTA